MVLKNLFFCIFEFLLKFLLTCLIFLIEFGMNKNYLDIEIHLYIKSYVYNIYLTLIRPSKVMWKKNENTILKDCK